MRAAVLCWLIHRRFEVGMLAKFWFCINFGHKTRVSVARLFGIVVFITFEVEVGDLKPFGVPTTRMIAKVTQFRCGIARF